MNELHFHLDGRVRPAFWVLLHLSNFKRQPPFVAILVFFKGQILHANHRRCRTILVLNHECERVALHPAFQDSPEVVGIATPFWIGPVHVDTHWRLDPATWLTLDLADRNREAILLGTFEWRQIFSLPDCYLESERSIWNLGLQLLLWHGFRCDIDRCLDLWCLDGFWR